MQDIKLLRETYIEIDLDRIAHNVRSIKQMCGPHTRLGAVVKADAYGHGACELADTLIENGADILCVAALGEALALKRQNPDYPVLIMGLTPESCFPLLLEHNITQTIDTLEQAEVLNALAAGFASAGSAMDTADAKPEDIPAKKKARVHLKVDTGFHRLGIPADNHAAETIRQICSLPYLRVEGIFTHLALLDDASNALQFEGFMALKAALEEMNVHIPCWHLADSIAAVDYPKYRLDMIRAGAILYGLKGFHKGQLDIRQALSFKTRINHISALKAGEGVSYDFTWRAPKDTRVATLPFGYADGYPRSLNGKGFVTLHGKRVPIIGIICMDQCMIDLSQVPEAQLGDEVIIYGDGSDNTLSIQEISQLAGTNKNDIVARLTRRPSRVYLKEGRVHDIRTMLD